jgi:hypothetical protein
MAERPRSGPEKASVRKTVGVYDRPARADSRRYAVIAIAVAVVVLATTGVALLVF